MPDGRRQGIQKVGALNKIKFLSTRIWEEDNRIVLDHANAEKIEAGREARIDCTVVESNIHPPTDAAFSQAQRRVFQGESAPACEKIVSIIGPRTDAILKDRWDVCHGRKICLTDGRSNLVLDCKALKSNPAGQRGPGQGCGLQIKRFWTDAI